MYLDRSISVLFGTVRPNSSKLVLTLTILILVVGFSGFLVSQVWIMFPVFEFFSFLIGFLGFLALAFSGGNVLFLFRFFLVWVLIFGTGIIWSLFEGEVKVAPFGVIYQDFSNTKILVIAGFFSLCGSLLGWHFAMFRFSKVTSFEFEVMPQTRYRLKWLGLVIAFTFSLLYIYKAGGIVGVGNTYASNVRDLGIEFGVFNIFHYIGISMLLLAGLASSGVRTTYIWLALLTLILGILTGSRADYLPQAFILFIFFFNYNVNGVIKRISSLEIQKAFFIIGKWVIYGAAILFLGYYLSLSLAVWRQGDTFDLFSKSFFDSDYGILFTEVYGHPMLYFETGNMILGSFYAAIVNVSQYGYLLGESYFDYLLLAPPAFLGFARPVQLELQTSINGLLMAQGGIFEVAEAYWNFGYVGAFLIPFFISYSFFWLLARAIRLNSIFYLIWYMVFGFMSLRAVWYQNFSYFRIFTIMVFLYIFSFFVFRWLIAIRVCKISNI